MGLGLRFKGQGLILCWVLFIMEYRINDERVFGFGLVILGGKIGINWDGIKLLMMCEWKN